MIALTWSESMVSMSKATTRPTLNWVTSLQKSVTVEGRGSWVRRSWLSRVRFWGVEIERKRVKVREWK